MPASDSHHSGASSVPQEDVLPPLGLPPSRLLSALPWGPSSTRDSPHAALSPPLLLPPGRSGLTPHLRAPPLRPGHGRIWLAFRGVSPPLFSSPPSWCTPRSGPRSLCLDRRHRVASTRTGRSWASRLGLHSRLCPATSRSRTRALSAPLSGSGSEGPESRVQKAQTSSKHTAPAGRPPVQVRRPLRLGGGLGHRRGDSGYLGLGGEGAGTPWGRDGISGHRRGTEADTEWGTPEFAPDLVSSPERDSHWNDGGAGAGPRPLFGPGRA